MQPQTYLALDTGLVDDIVDIVSRDAGFGRRCRNIEDLSCQTADFSHRSNSLGIEYLNLVAVRQRAVVLGIAIFPPDRVRDRLGNGAVIGERIDGSELSREREAGERVVETGSWIW